MSFRQIIIVFFVAALGFSCDDQLSGFGYPTYDNEGNPAIDREKIDEYLKMPTTIAFTGYMIHLEW